MNMLMHAQKILFLGSVCLLTACGGGDRYPETTPIILGPHQVLVGYGDTVYRIAYQNGVSTRDLIETNRLAPPYTLKQGQILVLPEASKDVGSSTVVADGAGAGEAGADSGEGEMDSLKPLPLTAIPHESEPGDHPRDGLKNLGERPPLRQENVLPNSDEKASPPRTNASEGAKGTGAGTMGTLSKPKETAVVDDGKFNWPVEGDVIGKFGRGAGKSGQDGIRIAANEGTPVRTIQAGEVIYVGDEIRNLGKLILVQHKGGWISAYGHLGRANVAVGDRVTSGQSLGSVGKTGSVKQAQLYFELRKNKKPVDPLTHLKS